MDSFYAPPRASLEQPEAQASGRVLPPGWGPIELLQVAWEVAQKDFMVWLAVAGISFGISLAVNLVSQFAGLIGTFLASALELDGAVAGFIAMAITGVTMGLSWLINTYLYLGQVRLALGAIRGQSITIGTLFSGYDVLPIALGAAILWSIGWVFGLVLLVFPGVIFALGTMLYLYALVDRNMGVIESMQESWRLTDGYKGTIFVSMLVVGVLTMIAGCVTCGLGFLLLTPIYALTMGLIYETLVREKGT